MGKKIAGFDVDKEAEDSYQMGMVPTYENLDLKAEVYLGIIKRHMAYKGDLNAAANLSLELGDAILKEKQYIKKGKSKVEVVNENKLKYLSNVCKKLKYLQNKVEGPKEIEKAIKYFETYISNHKKDQKLLKKYEKKSGGLEKEVLTGLFALLGGFFLLSPNITGNAIAGINSKITTGSGIIFLICGLLIGFLYFRTKK